MLPSISSFFVQQTFCQFRSSLQEYLNRHEEKDVEKMKQTSVTSISSNGALNTNPWSKQDRFPGQCFTWLFDWISIKTYGFWACWYYQVRFPSYVLGLYNTFLLLVGPSQGQGFVSAAEMVQIGLSSASSKGKQMGGGQILLLLLRLRQCCSHPALMKDVRTLVFQQLPNCPL